MSRLATLDGLRLLLEYAKEELEAIGMPVAAKEVGTVLIAVRNEVVIEERNQQAAPSPASYPPGKLRLVYDGDCREKRSSLL